MKNLQVKLHLADGGLQEFQYADGREIIRAWFGDDFGPPPASLLIEAYTDDGRRICINITNDSRESVFISIDQTEQQTRD